MNVVFLDYDGVVNTPMWVKNENGKYICRYNLPSDNKVNDYQAVQWVSEFCQKYDYKIVVSSTWRLVSNYKECLINGGLRKGIEILGCTNVFNDYCYRGDEISDYLKHHPEIDNYLVFDDCTNMGCHEHRFVHCEAGYGFKEPEFFYAESLHKAFKED